jgi:hypothetical protein
VRKLAGATEPEIAALPGIGPRLASAVLAALRPSETGGPSSEADNGTGTRPGGQVEQA